MIIKSFGAGGGKSFDLKRQVLLVRNPTGKEEQGLEVGKEERRAAGMENKRQS